MLGAVVNSVVKGKEAPIQVQVQDVEKCFDKLWLEATTNELYEAGMNNNMLNLIYNKKNNSKKQAKIAVKINGNLCKCVTVKNVEM